VKRGKEKREGKRGKGKSLSFVSRKKEERRKPSAFTYGQKFQKRKGRGGTPLLWPRKEKKKEENYVVLLL